MTVEDWGWVVRWFVRWRRERVGKKAKRVFVGGPICGRGRYYQKNVGPTDELLSVPTVAGRFALYEREKEWAFLNPERVAILYRFLRYEDAPSARIERGQRGKK